MERFTRFTNTIFSVSILLATSVNTMQGRNKEFSNAQFGNRRRGVLEILGTVPEIPDRRRIVQKYLPDSSDSAESLDGITSSVSKLKLDSGPRTRSRFLHRKSDMDSSLQDRCRVRNVDSKENYRFLAETNQGQKATSTSNGRARKHPREILNIQKLDLHEVLADYSSEEEHYTSPSRKDSYSRSTAAHEFRRVHGTDGTWEYARRMQKEKRLHIFCTSVQRISRNGLSLVKEAHLTTGLLNLGRETIIVDAVRFKVAKNPSRTYYITKGLRPDCVFALSLKMPNAGVFILGKEVCHIEGPSPMRASGKARNLQEHSPALALFSHLGKLFGLLSANKNGNM